MMIKVEKMTLRFERVHVFGGVLRFGDRSLKWVTGCGVFRKKNR